MPSSHALPFLAVLALAAAPASAALITESTRTFPVGTDIPDLQDPLLVFDEIIDDSAIVSLTAVEVGLHLLGVEAGSGFASEMFVSLNKDFGATSILLNQVGVSGSDIVGAVYDGWNATFRDDAPAGDIHQQTPPSGVLGGTWQPDGRTDADVSVRSRMLDVFLGSTGNGIWRLGVGDLLIGGQMRLESWSLTLTGETGAAVVPECRAWGAVTLLSALVVASRRQARREARRS